ncbi:DUF4369 domain-containing protein [Flavobacterium sp. 20NA77.7]|uniref:DUF4369 domain-containing protein n=1 Tax=Flavobacterium nakdongensis TaxID=3073563 RepID=A0ABY9RAW4_9FLAO|nr:DUF4369 domain-containing protein [Flavobacterium sp. 20NA77.7]WMW78382.1 DUF4369 domain-containing protein [Flavobacterium sp. 20NA77.7]
MKKIVALAILVLALACSKENTKKGNLHLVGNIDGLKQGKIYIQQLKDTSLINLDTIQFEGKSSFDTYLQLEEPQMLYIFLDRGQTKSIDNTLQFFAEPGVMKFETTLKEFYASARFTGSKNQKVYEEYQKIKNNIANDKIELVAKELKNLKTNNTSISEKIKADKDKLTIRKYLYTANFAVVNGKSEVAPYLALSEIPDANLKLLDTIQKSMSPQVAKSLYGKRLTQWIKERREIEK